MFPKGVKKVPYPVTEKQAGRSNRYFFKRITERLETVFFYLTNRIAGGSPERSVTYGVAEGFLLNDQWGGRRLSPERPMGW